MCWQTALCKRTLLYSALQFCITARPNTVPVVIFYCILTNTETETCFYLDLCKSPPIYRFSNTDKKYGQNGTGYSGVFTVSSWVSVKMFLWFCGWCGGSGKKELLYFPWNNSWYKVHFPILFSVCMEKLFRLIIEIFWG